MISISSTNLLLKKHALGSIDNLIFHSIGYLSKCSVYTC